MKRGAINDDIDNIRKVNASWTNPKFIHMHIETENDKQTNMKIRERVREKERSEIKWS